MPRPLIPPSAFAGPRAALLKILVHACTYTPVTTTDTDGDEVAVLGTPIPGIACRYEAGGQVLRDATGRTIVSVPSLTVAHDAPLAVGNRIEAITNSGGDVLLAGPLGIARRLDDDPLGLPLLKTYELFGADPGRSA